MAKLIVTLPDSSVQEHPLTLKPQDIGRDPSCNIQIDDATVSRRHADIRGNAQGQFTVRDLGSKNGTLVNDVNVTTKELKNGDHLLFGSVSARIDLEDGSLSNLTVMLEDQSTLAPESVSLIGPQHKPQLSQQRLENLCSITDRLTALRERGELLEDIMRICIEAFDFERGAIGLHPKSGRGLEWPVVHNLRGHDGEIKISRTILRQALEDGQRAVYTESAQNNLDPTVSIVQQGTRSAMCVPIAYSDKILGIIYGDRISTTRNYEKEDVDYFAALAQQVSIGLTNARLLEEQQQMLSLEREIAIARQIQADLFPDTLDVHPALDVSAINEPGRQVSGDYYDIIKMNDGRLAFIIADVTGKGVASALIAANLQAAVRLLLPESTDLAELTEKLNRLVYENTDASRFVTALIALIDPMQKTLSYVSAGHHHPYVITSPNTARELLSTDNNFPLGIEPVAGYKVRDSALDSLPCTLFFYTDGLNEAMNENEEEFGNERITTTLQQNADCEPGILLKNVRQSVADFCGTTPQSDDITLIAVRLKA